MSESSFFLPPRECDRPYTVSEINSGIAQQLESGNTLVWVEGEISTWRPSSSGHCYFRLKDGGSQIPAVMWRSTIRDLTFKPVDGTAVMAIATIRVYQRGGYYQLDVHRMQPLGLGALHVAFQKLKNKLEHEGLFDPSFKQPLPESMQRIAVITSKTGAALRDIVRVVNSRSPQTGIVLCDVLVQGDTAPRQIVKAIERCNSWEGDPIDCIIVGRGGGSLEDLWAFNDETVARAIFASKIPVISAIGHEIDFTIADYVADMRAATPSAAAEIAVRDTEDEKRRFSVTLNRFRNGISRSLTDKTIHFNQLLHHHRFKQLLQYFGEQEQYLDEIRFQIKRSLLYRIERSYTRASGTARQLAALNPLSVLSRGYSVTTDKAGAVIRSFRDVRKGDAITLRFHEGGAYALIDKVFSSDDKDKNVTRE
jgi:exodeoxyribonuclease VII large subunit